MEDNIFDKVQEVDLQKKMEESYIEYAMSVIASRALPDVRDGLKPVQRRILYSMIELNNGPDKPHRKCARIVGDTMGKYHPHGDSSIYGALVNMAQDWSTRYPLVDGHGNFGSVDGDGAAAMRYTEARLSKISMEMLADINKNTIDFVPNFDGTEKEPTVLPSRYPNLLANGTSGIAVGMATNIPPHNLREIINAVVKIIDNQIEENRETTIEEILSIVKGPDFPTGATILGTRGIEEAYRTGRGKIRVRAVTDIETMANGKTQIIVTELPYLVNKARLIEKIAELVESKKIDGIAYVNDESDRNGMRIVIKLKMGAVANVVLNTLYKYTQLQSAFSVNNIALVDGRPRLLNLIQLIKYFVRHRHDVIVRRTEFELKKAEARAHILEGLLKALDFIDEVIDIIRKSESVEDAKNSLISRFDLTDIQASAIVEMRLRQLAGLERAKLRNEYDEIMARISRLKDILGSYDLQMEILCEEMESLKKKFGDERKTDIELSADEFNPEDFYPNEDVVITISHMGYIKRTPLSEYRLQNRGGVGAKGSTTRDEDFIEHIYVANMHSTMLFFTKNGKCYWLKVYEIPEGAKASKGRAIQNVINIEPDDKVCAYLNVNDLKDEEYINNNYIVLGTKCGVVKKTTLEAYSRPRANGVNAITIKEGDELLEAILTDGNSQILIAGRNGKCVRFNEADCRPIGRTAAGVRGITLEGDDEVIGMISVGANENNEAGEHTVLVVSENGYGKKSPLEDYRLTSRGGKGVKTINITEKTGKLVALKYIGDENDLMIINKSGITIRVAASDIRVAGRATQGVKLINIREGDGIAAVCVVNKSEEKLPETTGDE